jgi:hypothetical protein
VLRHPLQAHRFITAAVAVVALGLAAQGLAVMVAAAQARSLVARQLAEPHTQVAEVVDAAAALVVAA